MTPGSMTSEVWGSGLSEPLVSQPGRALTVLNIRNTDIHKAVDLVRVGDAERYRRLVGGRAASDVDKEPRICDLNVRRCAAAVAFAQNAPPENRFVEASRSVDVGDGEEVCDGEPIPGARSAGRPVYTGRATLT